MVGFLALVALFMSLTLSSFSQSVSVGKGSYSTTLPSGEVGPSYASGGPVLPKISPNFTQKVQTNDFWSSLIYPFYGVSHSNNLYAHPLNVKATASGFQMGYTPTTVFAANDYLYPYFDQLTVGVDGLSGLATTTESYGDWTATARLEQGEKSLLSTFGHGLPFVFFTIQGGDALITSANSTVFKNEGEVLGITKEGRHFGVFGPEGSSWTATSPYRSDLNGESYLSVALLPDNSDATFELFRKHAYAHVVDSRVSWEYDDNTAILNTTYSYTTELKETREGLENNTLTALYRHQWLWTNNQLTSLTYKSPRGEMKLLVGNEFTTTLRFSGILPSLPDEGDYNRNELSDLIDQVAVETIPTGPSYENGKAMGRFAHLVNIADQLGKTDERDHFISELKKRLEDWLTAGGSQQYVYNANWNVLTGYPSGFGADNQINDHHFHSSYAIMSAAIVAQYDSVWASQENWGGMINMLIRDSNSWNRDDELFPFLRSHDIYAGHSWAAGHGDFGDGNNQESSSESMNFAAATFLWGEITGQKEIRDLGIFLHTTETTAVDEYWFDVHNQVFPPDYKHVAIGMVWGGKGVHSTWFGANPEFIHGINFLPITSGSLYLGRHPEYVKLNYEEIFFETNGQIGLWKDIIWQYLALSDANLAMSLYLQDPSYEPFDGETKAHTLHWLGNLKKMGHLDTTISADIPTYSVFKKGDVKTYAAFNSGYLERLVTFSDGYTLNVPAKSMKSENTSNDNENAPVAQLIVDKTRGKMPLTVNFDGSKSFDRNGQSLSFLWDIGGLESSSNAQTSFSFVDKGEYWVYLTVTNQDQLSKSDSVLITVLGNGTPFTGTPISIPGDIQAENYDKGGQSVAYFDVDANNVGLAYRPNEGVDIEGSSDGGFDVYWMVAGEWLEYTINVTESGTYDVRPFVTTVPGFGNIQLFINGEPISDKIPVAGTGGWQNWQAKTIPNIPLESGQQILRVQVDSDTDKKGWLYSLRNISIQKSANTSVQDDLPTQFLVHQNYPNPFNPSTQLSFSLPAASQVRISVIDLSGRVVAQIRDGQVFSGGVHSVSFDGKNLASGMFFAVVSTDFGERIIKMTLLK